MEKKNPRAGGSDEEIIPITEFTLYLFAIGDRLHRGGLIASNDDFGGRVVRANYFPSISKHELQIVLSTVGDPKSDETITALDEPSEYELKLAIVSAEPDQPPIIKTRVAFSTADYLFDFVTRAS